MNERETRINWIKDKIHKVEIETEEGEPSLVLFGRIIRLYPVHAAVTLRRKALEERRVNLRQSESRDELLHSRLSELEIDLETAE